MLLNRTIGIGGDLAGAKRLLAHCAANAPRGGRLIFDSYEITNPTGLLERKLRYKYRGQYSDPFPWVQFSSQIAGPLDALGVAHLPDCTKGFAIGHRTEAGAPIGYYGELVFSSLPATSGHLVFSLYLRTNTNGSHRYVPRSSACVQEHVPRRS